MIFQKTILFRAYNLLHLHHRQKGMVIIFLLIINSIIDFFSLAFFLPLLYSIINPDFISNNELVHRVYVFFGFRSGTPFIIAFTLFIFVFILAKNLISGWIVRTKARYSFGISNDLSLRALHHYLEMNYAEFSKVDFTEELNRIASYPFAFANNIILPVTNLISEVFVTVLILTGIALYDYKVILFLFLILLPTLFLYRIRRKRLKEINHDLKEKYPLLAKYANQVVEGFSEIKAYRKETYFRERFRTMSENVTNVFIKDQIIQSSSIRLTEIIVTMMICSLVVYSIITKQQYPQTLLLLGVYTGASFRVIPSVNRILHASQQIRIHAYLIDELNVLLNSHIAPHPAAWLPCHFHETIELKNISYAYPGRAPVLQDVSLVIPKGDKIGVTGKSGEGKTTLLLICLRLLKETGGEILVDNKLLTNERGWQKLFGYVPQNPYILDGTVAENIAFGIPSEGIDRIKVLQLIDDLDLVELSQQLPNGIDTRIGERGVMISGGQRQRLSIARALYSDVEILLLDEITNQLHPQIEMEIINLLDRLAKKGKTIIVITHKLPHTGFFDSVYRLEDGRLHVVAGHS